MPVKTGCKKNVTQNLKPIMKEYFKNKRNIPYIILLIIGIIIGTYKYNFISTIIGFGIIIIFGSIMGLLINKFVK
jgi:membrane protein YdbS with pleckstrin-like domain